MVIAPMPHPLYVEADLLANYLVDDTVGYDDIKRRADFSERVDQTGANGTYTYARCRPRVLASLDEAARATMNG